MRFGNCIGITDYEKIKILKDLGFDYAEAPIAPAYDAPQADIDKFASQLEKYDIKCEAVNFIFKGGIKIAGEEADEKTIRGYLSELFSKTKNLGYEIVVLGSGGARKISDPFPRERAMEQIVFLCRDILCEFAEKYNFTVAVEELNYSETNIINLVSEAKEIADAVNHPRCKVLLDFYHIALNKDDVPSIACLCENIAHTHIANPHKRYYPFWTDDINAAGGYGEFFGSLKKAGYNGRMSIEGNGGVLAGSPLAGLFKQQDFENDCRYSLEFLKYLDITGGLKI